jgi:cytoskeleton protein RodZ
VSLPHLIEVHLMSELAVPERQPSAGTLIRNAREAAGLHIGALSASLKVPVKKLEALEGDRVDLLPDAVFARALASSVCRSLKIDAAPILAALPQLALPKLGTKVDGINASFRTNASGVQKPIWAQLTKPWVMAVLALAAGTLLMLRLPFLEQNVKGLATTPTTGLARALPEGTQKNPSETLTLRMTDVPAPDTPTSTTASVVASADAKPDLNSSVANALQPPGSGQALAAPVPVPTSVQDGILIIRTRGSSWVEVTDASGDVRLRKVMIEGESLGVSGSLPMKVVLGRANMAEVQVRGKTFDLTPASKDNVARFEVR